MKYFELVAQHIFSDSVFVVRLSAFDVAVLQSNPHMLVCDMGEQPVLRTIDRETWNQSWRAIGIDPSTLPWPPFDDPEPVEKHPARNSKLITLTDEEWALIEQTGALPRTPRQARMSDRQFCEAVISVVANKLRWTQLDSLGISSDAVRKKFVRYSRKGVWTALANSLDHQSTDTELGRMARLIADRELRTSISA